MFKGMLGSKRAPSSEFTMLTTSAAGEASASNGKENVFDGPSRSPIDSSMPPPALPFTQKSRLMSGAWKAGKGKQPKEHTTEQDFDRLLDELQIPDTIRPKLATMEPTVKAAMLKSSQFMAALAQESSAPSKSLRRTRSIDSIPSSSPQKKKDGVAGPEHARQSMELIAPVPQRPATHVRGKSRDAKGSMRNVTPSLMCELLAESSTTLDIEVVKKLRLCLRNEPAGWTQEFLSQGGYSALLSRLIELLEVEWREEQHGDQMLHELLRCFKGLLTSSIGCFALRSSAPTPYSQLMALLYSDKKPGEVACRQVIVELLLGLFDLYPPSALPSISSRSRREAWDAEEGPTHVVALPKGHKSLFSFMRTLLLTEAPAPAERTSNPISPHTFIEELHTPRIYKPYLQELSDLCRDYFWVFCHPNNTIWAISEVDEEKVEKPRAPGGMTGGVEFEAMGYMTMHLRFVNSLAQAASELRLAAEDPLSAYQFHRDLFLSGFERILLVARKASTTYYPTLHLEIARYTAHTVRARFELPWTVSRLIGLPPSAMCLPINHPSPSDIPLPASPHGSPRKKRTGGSPVDGSSPHIPPTRRHEPFKLD